MFLPDGSAVKNPPGVQENKGSIPGSGRSPGKRNGNPLQYSCLENHMDRGAWWATAHELSDWIHDNANHWTNNPEQSSSKELPLSVITNNFNCCFKSKWRGGGVIFKSQFVNCQWQGKGEGDYTLEIQLTSACYLMCSIPISMAAKSALSLPIIQQRLNRESKSAGRLGRKYTSWTKSCWDSAGRTTTVPSCGSSEVGRQVKFQKIYKQELIRQTDRFHCAMLNSNISITWKKVLSKSIYVRLKVLPRVKD